MVFRTGQNNPLTLTLPWPGKYGNGSQTLLNSGITWGFLNATLKHSALIGIGGDLVFGLLIKALPVILICSKIWGTTDMWQTLQTYVENQWRRAW